MSSSSRYYQPPGLSNGLTGVSITGFFVTFLESYDDPAHLLHVCGGLAWAAHSIGKEAWRRHQDVNRARLWSAADARYDGCT